MQTLLNDEECFTRGEALCLLQRELACLEAEERGRSLIVDGWGENLDLGLLQKGTENKPSTWHFACRRKRITS